MNQQEKKAAQLGINPSTAQNRLLKDLLFQLVSDAGRNTCFHCGGQIDRGSFSVEHKTPWLDSENPRELFFDLENIAFSHLGCNVGKSRKPHQKYLTREEYRAAKAKRWAEARHAMSPHERAQRRKDQYLRTGK